jgi:hypothetical protein
MARGDVQNVNPSTRWFKWAGSTGTVSYYDKEIKEDVEVGLPFTFLLLDVFSTITGFNESAGEKIWSNEVKDLSKDTLTVKSGKEVIARGLYKDIKDTAISKGGGYAQSCYIAFKDEKGSLVIGNFMMKGSSFGGGVHKPADKNMKDIEIGGWMAFCKANKNELYTKAIVLEGKDDRICVNGATKFYAPKFRLKDIDPETDKKAIELTQVLKAYMAEYFKQKDADENLLVNQDAVVAAQVEESLKKTFGATTAELTATEQTFLVKPEVEDKGPLAEMGELPSGDDLQELPF